MESGVGVISTAAAGNVAVAVETKSIVGVANILGLGKFGATKETRINSASISMPKITTNVNAKLNFRCATILSKPNCAARHSRAAAATLRK
jgi:hypothetical protein